MFVDKLRNAHRLGGIVILCISLAIINPIFSLIVSLYAYIYFKHNSYLFILILNFIVLNYFKQPVGDYYRYFIFYESMGESSLEEFFLYVTQKGDFIFYLIRYVSYNLGVSFSQWAAIQSFLCYIFIFLTINLIKKDRANYLIFLLVLSYNPYTISRAFLATSIVTYGLALLLKKRQLIGIGWILIAVFTHISTIFAPLVYLLSRLVTVNRKWYLFFLVGSVICVYVVKSLLFKVGDSLGIPTIYFDGDLVFVQLSMAGKIKVLLLTYIIPFFMLFSPFFIKANDKSKELKFIILSGIVTLSIIIAFPIIGRRLLFVIFPFYILCLSMVNFSLNRLWSWYLVFFFHVNFISHTLYGFYTSGYPVHYEEITSERVYQEINPDGTYK